MKARQVGCVALMTLLLPLARATAQAPAPSGPDDKPAIAEDADAQKAAKPARVRARAPKAASAEASGSRGVERAADSPIGTGPSAPGTKPGSKTAERAERTTAGEPRTGRRAAPKRERTTPVEVAKPASEEPAGRRAAAQAKPAGASEEVAAKPRRKRGMSARHTAAERRASAQAVRMGRRKKTEYDLLIEGMHAPPPEETRAEASGLALRPLVLRVQTHPEPFVLTPSGPEGGFDESQLALAKEAFGSWPKGPTPHPRVLELVYAATLYFDVPYVYLISGIRKDRGGSRHSHGLAADVVLPGVLDDDLAAFFRAQGFVGVGTYPRSGFVHVDTRDKSYFWIDHSLPNRRGRVVTVRADEAEAVDEAAVARGNDGFVNPPRLQKALRVRAAKKRRVQETKRAAVVVEALPGEGAR